MRGSNFIDSPQLTCFFTPTTYAAWDASIKRIGGTGICKLLFLGCMFALSALFQTNANTLDTFSFQSHVRL